MLREGQQKRWIEAGPIGDELDILAINGKREIVCVELKHKSNSDLYYGPFQAAVYRDAFVAAASSIAADMERLARQKMALGLLPAAAAPLLAIARPIAVRAMLIVVGQPSKEVMRRLEQSLDSCTGVECLILPDGDTR